MMCSTLFIGMYTTIWAVEWYWFILFLLQRHFSQSNISLFRFNHLLPYNQPREQDQLNDEFLEYQMMEEEDIPASIWGEAVIRTNEDGVYHRMDCLWGYLGSLKNRASGILKVPKLSKVAQIVLSLPHSNADAERTFSVIGLNKTDTRNRLSLDGTLSSIMTMKMSSLEPCFRYEPPAEVVKQAKTATVAYNRPNLWILCVVVFWASGVTIMCPFCFDISYCSDVVVLHVI